MPTRQIRHPKALGKLAERNGVPIVFLHVKKLFCGFVHNRKAAVVRKADYRAMGPLHDSLDDLAVLAVSQGMKARPVQAVNGKGKDHAAAVCGELDDAHHIEDVYRQDNDKGAQQADIGAAVDRRCSADLDDKKHAGCRSHGVVDAKVIIKRRHEASCKAGSHAKARSCHRHIRGHDREEDVEDKEHDVDRDQDDKKHADCPKKVSEDSRELCRVAVKRKHEDVYRGIVEDVGDAQYGLRGNDDLRGRQRDRNTGRHAKHADDLRERPLPAKRARRKHKAGHRTYEQHDSYKRQNHAGSSSFE